jgi:hypothetical protein
MNPTIELPGLIEDIYDAALEPARWNDVVVSINSFVGGQACGLIAKDTASQSGLAYYAQGLSNVNGWQRLCGRRNRRHIGSHRHLQHLFAKTGTNRQIDLVKLVAAYSSLLRRSS